MFWNYFELLQESQESNLTNEAKKMPDKDFHFSHRSGYIYFFFQEAARDFALSLINPETVRFTHYCIFSPVSQAGSSGVQLKTTISGMQTFFSPGIHAGEAEPKKTTRVVGGVRRIPAQERRRGGVENLEYFCLLRKGQAMRRKRMVSCKQDALIHNLTITCVGKRKLTYLPESETRS